MFFIHRTMVFLRKTIVKAYYKIIYGNRFICGENLKFRSGFKLYIEKTGKIVVGDNCFMNNFFSANSVCSITIGNNCIFGENVKIYDHNHIYTRKNEGIPINEQGLKSKPVVIGDNCWFGSNVVILSGVKIGSNVVVGANCLLYKDIPENSVVIHGENLIVRNG